MRSASFRRGDLLENEFSSRPVYDKSSATLREKEMCMRQGELTESTQSRQRRLAAKISTTPSNRTESHRTSRFLHPSHRIRTFDSTTLNSLRLLHYHFVTHLFIMSWTDLLESVAFGAEIWRRCTRRGRRLEEGVWEGRRRRSREVPRFEVVPLDEGSRRDCRCYVTVIEHSASCSILDSQTISVDGDETVRFFVELLCFRDVSRRESGRFERCWKLFMNARSRQMKVLDDLSASEENEIERFCDEARRLGEPARVQNELRVKHEERKDSHASCSYSRIKKREDGGSDSRTNKLWYSGERVVECRSSEVSADFGVKAIADLVRLQREDLINSANREQRG